MQYAMFIKIWIFAISAIIGISLYFLVFRNVLKSYNLLDTNKSLKIKYQQYLNSVLINAIGSEYWIWFDGKDVLVYGIPTGRICNDSYCTGSDSCKTKDDEESCKNDKDDCRWEKYEPVYIYDTTVNKPIGYQCAKPLYEIKSFYCCKNAPDEYIFVSNPNNKEYSMIDIINEFVKRKIININYKGDSVYPKGSSSK